MKEETKKSLRLLRMLKRIAFMLLVYFSVIVINQDLLIFPGVVRSMLAEKTPNPPEVIEHLLDTKDGRKVDVWELPVAQLGVKKKVALILHGNGGDVKKFYNFQEWFRDQGYSSYDFDYAGYGKSTGWMNEKRIYQDGEMVLRFIADKEKIAIEEVVILGISIGSGPSAYLAQLVQSKVLLLASGYSSIPDVVRTRPLFWFLTPLVRYNFPTASYLENTHGSCIVISHGKKDEVIGYDNSIRLNAAASKSNTVTYISSETGHHNDTFWEKSSEIKQALMECAK